MHSLLSDYATLLSSCPGVRHQTVVIDIHYSETFGLKIFYKFALEHMGGTLRNLNISWPAYSNRQSLAVNVTQL